MSYKKINETKICKLAFELVSNFLSIAFCLLLIIPSCKQQKKETLLIKNNDVYYTCSMHPQIHEDHPDNCPVCGMKLIAVPKSSASETMGIHLNEEQIKLANIKVDTIERGSIANDLVLSGTLNFNQNKLSSVSARVEGRIQKLYFKSIGDYVHKGDKLYDLYSEQLNNAKQEYINAVEQQNSMGNSLINYAAFVESARNKLMLWGLTNDEINQLTKNKMAPSLTTFYSMEEGYITSLKVNEGDYVNEGGAVLQLADLSTLWAEAQVYTTQMSFINKTENVSVQLPDLNNKIISGTIDFVNPEINPDTRINLVRVVISNKNNLLHPGMPAYIIIKNQQRNSITLPADAVLRDSKGATVWLQTKPEVYEVRMVQTGIINNGEIEITSGLAPDDIVVTSGAYLLNSEYIFEHGADPMAGMKM